MREYLSFHMQDRELRWSSIKTIVLDQFENLKLIWTLMLIKYLLDHLVSDKGGPKPFAFLETMDVTHQVYAIILFLLLPHPIEWLLQQAKANRRMGGMARLRLQSNLMRT